VTTFDDFRTQILDARPRGVGPDNLVLLDRVDSTNRVAARMVRDYLEESLEPPSALFLTCEQTAGRGRQGRVWKSPRGAGLYATRVLAAGVAGALSSLPLLGVVGLARALKGWLGERCGIKWPNDLLVGGRKIGGVLIEVVSRGPGDPVAVMGFSANHGGTEPPVPEATTLLRELAAGDVEAPSLGAFVWALVGAVETELDHLGDVGRAIRGYRELSVHTAGDRLTCRLGGDRLEGTFRGFDDRGFLLLETGGEVQHIATGEVVER
jgi:BirA family biotin operon repressor/biotin-[acetyl-CoA-carboxylase] ligase